MAKILLVDDNLEMLKMEGLMLTMEGHRVDIAERGERALEQYILGQYDLVILDLAMPFMNGYEVATKIRATGDLVTPIAFLTADPFPSQERMERLSPFVLWEKPTTREFLSANVEKVLRGQFK